MPLETLLMLALPAGGKSEIGRYLNHLDEDALAALGIGRPIRIDDYPYVHLMLRVSRELRRMGRDPVFFGDEPSSLLEPADWGTLIHLLNEDYRMIRGEEPEGPMGILARFDRAREKAGARPALASLPASAAARIERMLDGGVPTYSPAPDGATVVIEFARGGPAGSAMPLPAPLGYRYSLSLLAPEILSCAAILYVWVTPEQSRRRNRERARPGPEAERSILHHGVPEVVMHNDYGCDDLLWLADGSDHPESVAVETPDATYLLPLAVFDNREDVTSFLREDPRAWPQSSVKRLRDRLARVLPAAASRRSR